MWAWCKISSCIRKAGLKVEQTLLLFSMALINIPLMWDTDVTLLGKWSMGHVPISPFFAFAGLDDVLVSLGDCPQSLLHLAGWNLCDCPIEHEGGPGWQNHVLELNLKCLLHTYIYVCVYICTVQRIWIFSKHPVCNGFKYNFCTSCLWRSLVS